MFIWKKFLQYTWERSHDIWGQNWVHITKALCHYPWMEIFHIFAFLHLWILQWHGSPYSEKEHNSDISGWMFRPKCPKLESIVQYLGRYGLRQFSFPHLSKDDDRLSWGAPLSSWSSQRVLNCSYPCREFFQSLVKWLLLKKLTENKLKRWDLQHF